MARLKFKEKCRICKTNWVVKTRRDYPICVDCHMKQIFKQEVTDKKYQFLNIDKEIYEQSRFLRNIKQAYLMYEELTEKQIEAFKETAKKIKDGTEEGDED